MLQCYRSRCVHLFRLSRGKRLVKECRLADVVVCANGHYSHDEVLEILRQNDNIQTRVIHSDADDVIVDFFGVNEDQLSPSEVSSYLDDLEVASDV